MEFIDNRLLEYAIAHSDEVPALLKELERETYQKILHPRMLSGSLQGRFLSMLSQLIKPERIIEIGTFTGYATLCLAEGLTANGKIHTVDCNEELVNIQKKYFGKSPYKNQIQRHLGEALKILPNIDDSFDIAFLDADKENYVRYFELILPKMRKGGLIISDNVLWSGKVLESTPLKDKETIALQEFNVKLRNDKRISTVLLPLRDGLTLSRTL